MMNDPKTKPAEPAAEPEATAAPAPPEPGAPEPTPPQAATGPVDTTAPAGEPPPFDAAARIAELEAEVGTLRDQLLRALAEAENVRRRAQREREDTAKYAIAAFAKELLPVADNLRRALESVSQDATEVLPLVKTLIEGVEATERQLLAAFERGGIKRIEPLGEPFDPNFHQVMMEIENTGKPAGTVVQLFQPGYTIHGRLLREAIVGVAKREATEGSAHVNTTA